jgi:hypothetical protein
MIFDVLGRVAEVPLYVPVNGSRLLARSGARACVGAAV